MLETVRKHNKLFFLVFMPLVFLAFVFTGVQGYDRMQRGRAVPKWRASTARRSRRPSGRPRTAGRSSRRASACQASMPSSSMRRRSSASRSTAWCATACCSLPRHAPT